MRAFEKLVQESSKTRNNSKHIKVYDNFLNKEQFNKIQNIFCGYEIDWHFSKTLDEGMHEYGEKYNWQMGHVCYNYDRPLTKHFENVVSILGAIENKEPVNSLIRVKANLNARTRTNMRSGFHIDFHYEHSRTAIFYVNTNNGYTEFEDGTKVESKENRIVIFPTLTKHSGVTCTNKQNRVVINFNYF